MVLWWCGCVSGGGIVWSLESGVSKFCGVTVVWIRVLGCCSGVGVWVEAWWCYSEAGTVVMFWMWLRLECAMMSGLGSEVPECGGECGGVET